MISNNFILPNIYHYLTKSTNSNWTSAVTDRDEQQLSTRWPHTNTLLECS